MRIYDKLNIRAKASDFDVTDSGLVVRSKCFSVRVNDIIIGVNDAPYESCALTDEEQCFEVLRFTRLFKFTSRIRALCWKVKNRGHRPFEQL